MDEIHEHQDQSDYTEEPQLAESELDEPVSADIIDFSQIERNIENEILNDSKSETLSIRSNSSETDLAYLSNTDSSTALTPLDFQNSDFERQDELEPVKDIGQKIMARKRLRVFTHITNKPPALPKKKASNTSFGIKMQPCQIENMGE